MGPTMIGKRRQNRKSNRSELPLQEDSIVAEATNAAELTHRSASQGSVIVEENCACPIFSLSNEVLLMIFECPRVAVDENSPPEDQTFHFDYLSVLYLRQVCRRFRSLTNKLSCWLEDDFDFKLLFSWDQGIGLHSSADSRILALLCDDELVKTLSCKKTWSFSSYRSLCMAMHRIPGFCERVTRLAFEPLYYSGFVLPKFYSDPRIHRFQALRELPDLRFLVLRRVPVLNLSWILAVAPGLEVLNVISGYEGSSHSLQGFQNLTELDLVTPSRPGHGIELPLSSAKSLRILRLSLPSQFNISKLGQFDQLSSLSFGLFDSQARQVVTEANLNLEKFSICIKPYQPSPTLYGGRGTKMLDFDDVLKVLSSSSLKNLKELSISVIFHQFDRDTSLLTSEGTHIRLFRAISDLRSLETLNLSIPFQSTCFHHLPLIDSVSSVEWSGTLADFLNNTFNQRRSIALQEMGLAFEKTDPKPRCKVSRGKEFYLVIQRRQCEESLTH
jgi:F-box domain